MSGGLESRIVCCSTRWLWIRAWARRSSPSSPINDFNVPNMLLKSNSGMMACLWTPRKNLLTTG